MLLNYFRLLKYNGSDFTDYSIVNQEESTITPVMTSTDHMYIAQEFPFNNFYMYMDTANAATANINIEYWDGKEWQSGVDVLDGTKVGDATLGRSGLVQFSPDIEHGWIKVSETDENPAPDELEALTIYGLYWIRISFSADLDAGTVIKEVGYSFTSTTELNNIDVEINNFYPAFESGKSDWIREIITASKMVVIDMKRMGLIVHPGNILRLDSVSMATTYKTLELIYRNLGPSYDEKRKDVTSLYKDALNVDTLTIDQDNDGYVDEKEVSTYRRRLIR